MKVVSIIGQTACNFRLKAVTHTTSLGGIWLPSYAGDGDTVAALQDFGVSLKVFHFCVPTCRRRASDAMDITEARHGEGKRCDERSDKEGKGCHCGMLKVEIESA